MGKGGCPLARYRRAPWAVALAGLLACGLAQADKLVVFQNGRSMRVREIRSEGNWSYLTLGERSEIGVPGHLIADVREVDREISESVPNVQSSAGGPGGGKPAGGSARGKPTLARPGARISRGARTLQGKEAGASGTAAAAAQARREALRRAAARGGRNAAPGAGTGPSRQGTSNGTDLTPQSGPAWPSLLNRQGGPTSQRRRPGNGGNGSHQ